MSRANRSAAIDPLLTDAEVAQWLNVHKKTPANWRRKSTPDQRFGPPWLVISTGGGRSLVRYRRTDVEAFIEGGGNDQG